MARPRIPAAVLMDRGVPLTLLGGVQVTLCYTFKALMLLEERYGSINDALKIIGAADADDADDADAAEPAPLKAPETQMFTGLAGIMACGLAHEHAPSESGVPGDGNQFDDSDLLADYLDVGELAKYAAAVGEAFAKAFPTPTESPDPPVTATPSPGESGTTSPSSTSASPLVSSGT